MPITGRGNFPFNTKWVRKKNVLSKTIFWADKDQSLQTIMLDWFFESGGAPPPDYYGILKRWTGPTWIKELLKTYLAGSWQTKLLKRWNGSTWVLVDTTGV